MPKRVPIQLIVVALTALLCLIPGLANANQNLLKDGGFEDTPSEWQVRLGAAIRDGEALSGAKALLLPGPGRSDAFCGVAGLKPGQFYRVDAWAKTRGVHAEHGVTERGVRSPFVIYLDSLCGRDAEGMDGGSSRRAMNQPNIVFLISHQPRRVGVGTSRATKATALPIR